MKSMKSKPYQKGPATMAAGMAKKGYAAFPKTGSVVPNRSKALNVWWVGK